MKLVGHVYTNATLPGLATAGTLDKDRIQGAEYIGDGVLKVKLGTRNGKQYGLLLKNWSHVEWEDEPPVQGKK